MNALDRLKIWSTTSYSVVGNQLDVLKRKKKKEKEKEKERLSVIK